MKKLLVTSALAAVLSLSAQAKFEGSYAGVQASYSTTSAKLNGSVPNQPVFSVKPSGYGAGINGGYGCNHSGIYLGGDLQVGYDWSKKTSNGLQAKTTWDVGVGARIGVHPTDHLLTYIYLGIGYDKYKLNYTTNRTPTYSNISKTGNFWSYVPGIGASYMFSDKIFLDANYKYHTAIGTPESPKYYKWDKKPISHVFTVGAGYQF